VQTTRMCLVIDGHPVVRRGVRSVLASEFEVEELEDGQGASELLASVGFDVAVVEMRSANNGSPSGIATIRELLGAQPALGVVAFGRSPERQAVREALDAGASAYVSKASSIEVLGDAIRAASEQESFIDPIVGQAAATTLTPRQREVLQHFADGLSTEQVAQRLGLGDETIRTHAKASLSRMSARDRTHAVAKALRANLIE
jgi:DNA-binding NarL/FixJ family response regulator